MFPDRRCGASWRAADPSRPVDRPGAATVADRSRRRRIHVDRRDEDSRRKGFGRRGQCRQATGRADQPQHRSESGGVAVR